ncbi:hypothetical protein KRR38_34800 [Novosphingobium sp. G106]|uniref:hypothetical protein n=1 Tax=Novosphingobium sp. G106 TaxID=2849500 RepID=UPI001C2CE173|nr:hypothetical protein [Novosphingobium sp. G106]MBV1692664.1 hypothetical protein [Novosphingobium sp. G106]
MVLDIPYRFAGPTLPLGRHYPIIVETEAELMELLRTTPQLGHQSLMLLETLRTGQEVDLTTVPPSGR